VNEKTKQPHVALRLPRGDKAYPAILLDRLGEKAPETLTAIGPVEYLANRKTALFCSARAPGEAILRPMIWPVACAMKGQRPSAASIPPSKKTAGVSFYAVSNPSLSARPGPLRECESLTNAGLPSMPEEFCSFPHLLKIQGEWTGNPPYTVMK
jgi:hypothetical protein